MFAFHRNEITLFLFIFIASLKFQFNQCDVQNENRFKVGNDLLLRVGFSFFLTKINFKQSTLPLEHECEHEIAAIVNVCYLCTQTILSNFTIDSEFIGKTFTYFILSAARWFDVDNNILSSLKGSIF